MHLNDGINLSRTKISKLKNIARSTYLLAFIIDMKVAKIDASFLSVYWDICLHNSFYSYNRSM